MSADPVELERGEGRRQWAAELTAPIRLPANAPVRAPSGRDADADLLALILGDPAGRRIVYALVARAVLAAAAAAALVLAIAVLIGGGS